MRKALKIKMFGLVSLFFLIFGVLPGCKEVAENKKNIRIAVAKFSHETCTFCPKPTTIEDWEYYGPANRDIVDNQRGYIGGFKNMCEEFEGVELVGITSPQEARGGSSGSWNTPEVFEKYSGFIIEDLKKFCPFDGVFIYLHGAIAVK